MRSVSQRLEAIEDALDRVDQRIETLGSSSALDRRLAAIEELLARLEASLAEPAGDQAPDQAAHQAPEG